MSLDIPMSPGSKAAEIDVHIVDVLRHRVGKDERAAKPHDWYTATVYTLRDAIIDVWMESTRETYDTGAKRVYYLSLEFLLRSSFLENLALRFTKVSVVGNGFRCFPETNTTVRC